MKAQPLCCTPTVRSLRYVSPFQAQLRGRMRYGVLPAKAATMPCRLPHPTHTPFSCCCYSASISLTCAGADIGAVKAGIIEPCAFEVRTHKGNHIRQCETALPSKASGGRARVPGSSWGVGGGYDLVHLPWREQTEAWGWRDCSPEHSPGTDRGTHHETGKQTPAYTGWSSARPEKQIHAVDKEEK